MFKAESCGSLEKIFAKIGVMNPRNRGSMLANERYSFQVAFFSRWTLQTECHIEIRSDLEDRISFRVVEYASGTYNLPAGHDENYLFRSDTVTSYPDILKPFTPTDLCLRPNLWTAVWFTVDGGTAGEHTIDIMLTDSEGKKLCGCEYTLEVIDAFLPECGIPVTQWIHIDSICAYHRVAPFTEAFYEMFGRYLDSYILHSGNMLYTPLFTPPLNTPCGEERMTVQTVGVKIAEGEYEFDFTELEKYIDFARVHGIKYFELSHLATQWGAQFCPKIMAEEHGEIKRIFGWDTPSDGDAYRKFLEAFLPRLDAFLQGKGISDQCFVHISDEPRKEHFSSYAALSALVRKHMKNYKILDAMSDPSFYREGVVDIPVVALSGYEKFTAEMDAVRAEKWVYYCMEEGREYLSNCFFNMPLQRLRVLGFQLWLNGIRGFLHWGFNFYFDYNSRFLLDPHHRTDAGGAYPSGDSFVVYPDYPSPHSRVMDSVRLEVFDEAISDYRSLLLLAEIKGEKFVRGLLTENGFSGFSEYPSDGEAHLFLREKINDLIKGGNGNER